MRATVSIEATNDSKRWYSVDPGVELLLQTGRSTVVKTVMWTGLDGSVASVSKVGFLDEAEQVIREAFELAAQAGWTPKRWWQFWRWDDTPNPKALTHGE